MTRLMLPLRKFQVRLWVATRGVEQDIRGFDSGFKNTEGPIDGGTDEICLW